MALPTFTMRQLLEAGVHFGHQSRRWNPRMSPYLFGTRNGIHIIDLRETQPQMYRAMEAVRDIVANRGRVLFVGTKRNSLFLPLFYDIRLCNKPRGYSRTNRYGII